MSMYHDGNRELQDSFGSRALADRLEEKLTRHRFTEDDATFIANNANYKLTSLVKSDPFLLNIYHVMSVNPAKWPKVNGVGAKAYADFVTSSEGQEIIASFGKTKYGKPLFVADAGKSDADVK